MHLKIKITILLPVRELKLIFRSSNIGAVSFQLITARHLKKTSRDCGAANIQGRIIDRHLSIDSPNEKCKYNRANEIQQVHAAVSKHYRTGLNDVRQYT